MRITDFRPRQSKKAARLVADALADDPLNTFMVPDPQRRALPTLIHFRAALRMIRPAQAVRVAVHHRRIVGLASWDNTIANQTCDPINPRLARATGQLHRRVGDAWPHLVAVHAALRAVLEGEAGWQLSALAVHPGHQDTGIEQALLRDGLASADLNDQPVWLVASAQEEVPFYRQYGFDVTETIEELLPGAPTLWKMRRPVASAAPHPSVPGGATRS